MTQSFIVLVLIENVGSYDSLLLHCAPPLGGGPFCDASGNKNIGTSIPIGQEIRCLPYAGFLKAQFNLVPDDSLKNHGVHPVLLGK